MTERFEIIQVPYFMMEKEIIIVVIALPIPTGLTRAHFMSPPGMARVGPWAPPYAILARHSPTRKSRRGLASRSRGALVDFGLEKRHHVQVSTN